MPIVEISGLNFRYTDTGSGEVITFLHGFGSSADDWSQQLSFFSAFYRVIAIDMRGHGESDKPESGYSIQQMAKDVITILDTINIKKSHFVGLSLGAMVSIQLALDYPEYMSSIVIVNATPRVEMNTFAQRLAIGLRFAVVRIFGLNVAGKILAKKLFPEKNQELLRNRFLSRWCRNKKAPYLAIARTILNWNASSKLQQISMPCLIVSGEHDYTTMAKKHEYFDKIKNASFQLVENSRHATPADQPEQFNNIVKQFLDKNN